MGKLLDILSEKASGLAEDETVTISVGDLAALFPFEGDEVLSRGDVAQIDAAMVEVGLSSEPEIHEHYRKIHLAGSLVLFRSVPIDSISPSSLLKEKVFFYIAALIAKIDGEVSEEEVNEIEGMCKSRSISVHIPLVKLKAIANYALSLSPHELRVGLKGVVSKFGSGAAVLDFAKDVIVADGYIAAKELDLYEEMYSIFEGQKIRRRDVKKALIAHAKNNYITLRRRKNEQDQDFHFVVEDDIDDSEDSIIFDILKEF